MAKGGKMKRYFEIYDNYECNYELIGVVTNLKEAKKIMKERCHDTDGECYLLVIDENGKEIEIEW